MRKLNLVGQVFGRLTVISEGPGYIDYKGGKGINWVCECSCGSGKVVVTRGSNLKTGNVTSCGCYRLEIFKRGTHFKSDHPVYRTWASMRGRCLNPKDTAYDRYGGRGITICQEWLDDFNVFYTWMIAQGWVEGTVLSLDRVDNNRGYSPENCRLATKTEQSRNRRNNTMYTIYGQTLCFKEVWEKFALPSVKYGAFEARVKYNGWNIYEALYTPTSPIARKLRN